MSKWSPIEAIAQARLTVAEGEARIAALEARLLEWIATGQSDRVSEAKNSLSIYYECLEIARERLGALDQKCGVTGENS